MIKQVVNPISNINDDLVIPVKDLDETHEKKSQLKIVKYSKNMILFAVIYMSLTYLGKVYIYLMCGPTCYTEHRLVTKKKSKEVVDTCSCYKEIEIDNYWTTFNNSIVEAAFAFVVTSLLYLCCCKCCKRCL